MAKKDFDQLQIAVVDLLTELRVDPQDLRAMAEDYSPDYPGGPNGKTPSRSTCKVQISMVVANELIDAGCEEEDFFLVGKGDTTQRRDTRTTKVNNDTSSPDAIDDRCGCCGMPVRVSITLRDNYPTVEICQRCQGYRIWLRKKGTLHKTSWITPETCCTKQTLSPRRIGKNGERLDIVCNACEKVVDTQSSSD